MIAVDHRDDALPEPIAEQMEAAGLAPEVAVLQKIIAEFAEARARAGHAENADNVHVLPQGELFPLKGLLPIGLNYEVARRAAVARALGAVPIGGRWFVSKEELERWIARKGKRATR